MDEKYKEIKIPVMNYSTMKSEWTWQEYVDGGPELDPDMIKLAKLKRRMKAWEKENGWMPLDSDIGVLFEKDMEFIESCIASIRITKEEKIILNKIWKRYG